MVVQFLRLENLLLIELLDRFHGGLREWRLFLWELLLYEVVARFCVSSGLLCPFQAPMRSVSLLLLFDLIDNVIMVLVIFEPILQLDDVQALGLGDRLRVAHVGNVHEVVRRV